MSCNYLRRIFHVLCRFNAQKLNFIEHSLCIVLWGWKSCLNLKSYLLIFPKGLFCLIPNISPIKTKYVGVFWVNTMKISKCNRKKTWHCGKSRKCDLEEKLAEWQHVRRCKRQSTVGCLHISLICIWSLSPSICARAELLWKYCLLLPAQHSDYLKSSYLTI